MNLLDIRYAAERPLRTTLENEDVVLWCNDAQADTLMKIDIPASTTIEITSTALDYALPADFKRIGRMVFQSDLDRNADVPFFAPYRIYNGRIYFQSNFNQADTIVMDYYKHMTHFTDIFDTADLPERYMPLYTSYIQAQYFSLPPVVQTVGEAQAKREYEKNYGRYLTMKDAVSAFYTSQLQQSEIQGVW